MMRQLCMPSLRFALSGVVAYVAIGMILGCSEVEIIIQHVPVRGKVQVDGQPVPSGTVSFRPDAERGNQSMEQPAGMLQEDGRYKLFSANQEGAPPGWYRVLIIADNFRVVDPPTSPVWPEFPEGYLPKALVNQRYLYFHQTDLLVEVKENQDPDEYVLRLNP
ncbi:hypothetical protein [Bythopirellula goksoeyrii]|nr:hypothetical protein [Bythopirellula goksoeyrii]